MKTLRVLSVLFAALSLLFMVNAFLPAFTGTRPDWIMIAILLLFVVMIPSSMVGRIKMEKFPELLPSLGMIRFNIILLGRRNAQSPQRFGYRHRFDFQGTYD